MRRFRGTNAKKGDFLRLISKKRRENSKKVVFLSFTVFGVGSILLFGFRREFESDDGRFVWDIV